MRWVRKYLSRRKIVTLPTPDAQSSEFSQRRPHSIPPTYSIPARPQVVQPTSLTTPPPIRPAPGIFDKTTHEHAIDFATHSWDLATGGLKTLTAKREFPTRSDRRSADPLQQQMQSMSRNYMFALITLSCIVLMLIGGGIILFVMLQP